MSPNWRAVKACGCRLPALRSMPNHRTHPAVDRSRALNSRALQPSERIAPLAPRTPALPAGTASNPIDRFIDAYFVARKVKPPALVADTVFARRAWLDILGLPPTPEELREFEQNKQRIIALEWLTRFWPIGKHTPRTGSASGTTCFATMKASSITASASPLRVAAWRARRKYSLRRHGSVAARSPGKIESEGFLVGRHLARRGQRESDAADAGRAERRTGLPRDQHEMRGLPRQLYQPLEIARYIWSCKHVFREALGTGPV